MRWKYSEYLPAFDARQVACFAVAVPLVYYYDHLVYEAMVGLYLVLTKFVNWVANSPPSVWWWDNAIRAFAEKRLSAPVSVLYVIACALFGVFILLVVIPILLAVGIPYAIIRALFAAYPTPTKFGVDAMLVAFVGISLRAIVIPLLWMALAPLLAATVGEIRHQHLREKVHGEPARLRQPTYLLVGIVLFTAGMVRLSAPVIETVQQRWRENVSLAAFPPTPTPTVPPEWPKNFTVLPKQKVKTGVKLKNKNQEVLIHADKHLFVYLNNGQRTLLEGRDFKSPADRFHFAATGEIIFEGGDEPAIAHVFEPKNEGRLWLNKGDVIRTRTWVARDETFRWCGGWGLAYRTVSQDGASDWADLKEKWTTHDRDGGQFECKSLYETLLDSPARSGFVEFRARYRTWLNESSPVAVNREEKAFEVPAETVFDTEIEVRKGDQVRISSKAEALYAIDSSGQELLIRSGYFRVLEYKSRGTVRLKGGVKKSNAVVLLEARGSDWK